ncbi:MULTISPECIES: OmpA family protein [Aquirufa]|uniref:OmpA family protein n=2 Tax=Aquirufa TaxID=2676247 RepID=A0ABT4JG79_9BACT|nr:OmpA family protein [Aquirufa ecclesiirivi]MCZ2473510.1 OmpA family protein [Aquirufa ecclesiirivi]MCZ2475294.1 OmpA family protein [Aquirufa ecclesiirivi]MDF0692289.1 OmpA family protein [Aquirufa ecclesiirivi]NHC48328.1 OmpA family protein [Aquirufa ecclesiirivi]
MKKLLLVIALMPFFFSCASKKKIADLQSRLTELQASSDQSLAKSRADLADCQSLTASLQAEIKKRDGELEARTASLKNLQEQLDYMKRTNTNLLDRLSDLSVINKSGAESIRKSLDALNEQGKYIKDLNSTIQRKDSINLSLVMNLKRSLADVNDEDVTVEVKKGVVYISISDKLMFASGSSVINSKAEAVLAKVAKVINDHKDLDILVEGHTDSVPISTDCIKDNWDLSAKRATSVVRLLQTRFSVDPERMTAGGRGEFEPQAENKSKDGRKMNRRTEIIVTPKLDQFFNLLAPPSGK